MNPPRDTKLSDESVVTVALFRWVVGGIITGAAGLIGAAMWATSVNAKLGEALTATQASVLVQSKQSEDIALIKQAIVDVKRDLSDQWKLSDTIWWTAEFQRLNPTINMPALGTMPSLMRSGKKDER